MSAVPPVSEVVDAFVRIVIPAFSVSAIVGWLVPKIFGRQTGFVAATLAILLGLLTANALRGIFVYRFDSETPLTASAFVHGFWEAVRIPIPSSETAEPTEHILSPRAGRYWIPCAIVLAAVGGLLANQLKTHAAFGWMVKLSVSLVAVRMVVPASLAEGQPWILGALFLTIVAEWLVVERLSAKAPAGLSMFCVTLAAIGAATVLIHAHSARLTDAATMIAVTTCGVAVATRWGIADSAGAIPASAVFLPAILLSGYHETFSDIPAVAFALPALAPITAGFLLLVPVPWQKRWWPWVLVTTFVGLPTAVAIILTVRAESLSF